MAKPTDYPYWATVDENDPVLGTPNKVVPSAEKQSYGQRANRNTLRQDINYLFNKIRQWIQWFDEQSAVGDVHISVTNVAPATLSGLLGGTWIYIDSGTGVDTIAGVTVYVYQRTV